jgi:hypothetical protein
VGVSWIWVATVCVRFEFCLLRSRVSLERAQQRAQPVTGGQDAIANMVAILAVYEASGLGVRH